MPHLKNAYIKKVLFSRLFLLVGVLFLVLFSSALGREVIRHYQIKRDIASLEAQVDSLENKEKDLNNMISYYESNDFLEKEARMKLNLKTKGESVLVIPGIDEEEDKEEQNKDENKSNMEFANNISRWLGYFKYGNKE